jgi:hypothetical protein
LSTYSWLPDEIDQLELEVPSCNTQMRSVFDQIGVQPIEEMPFCVSHECVEWKEDMQMVFSSFLQATLFDT